MDTKIKIIVCILFVLLGYNIYEYYINIEGWSDSEDAATSAPYDISVTPGVAVSLSGLDSSKTYTHTIASFTQTEGAGASSVATTTSPVDAQGAWTRTGLAIGDDGSITGTTSSDANIDGVFGFQFTETPDASTTAATQTPVSKYLKIKIIAGNDESIAILDASGNGDAAAIAAAGGSGSCSSGQEIDNEANPCLPDTNESDQERMSELLGTCNASDGSAIRGLAPPSLQTAVDDAQAEVDRAQAEYDDEWYFNGDEKEVLDEAKAKLVKAMEDKETGTPPVTKRLCDEKNGTWVPAPPGDNAQNACTALQIRKAEIAARLEKARIDIQEDPSAFGMAEHLWDNSVGPGQLLNNIVDTAGGSAEAKQVLSDVLNVDINSINVQSHSSQCENRVTSVNTNELRITSNNANCSNDRITERMESEGGSFNPSAYNSDLITVSDINQTIKGKNKGSCILDSILSSDIGQTSTIDNSAMMSAIQNMTGGGKIDSEPNACVDVSVTQSACSYVKDKQCCHNEIQNTRSNILEIGGECPNILAQDITQMVDITSIAECSSNDTATANNTQTQATTLNPDLSGDQTMTPNYIMYLVIGIVAVVAVCVVGYIIYLRLGGGGKAPVSAPVSPPPEP